MCHSNEPTLEAFNKPAVYLLGIFLFFSIAFLYYCLFRLVPLMSLPRAGLDRPISFTQDPYSRAEIYYGDRSAVSRKDAKHRTFSAIIEPSSHPDADGLRFRRGSVDAPGENPRKFLIPVESTLKDLLSREDSDHNSQITIDDSGPKVVGQRSCGVARS